jgi:hypothetical protein
MEFKKSVLREEIRSRGGGVEIDLSSFGFEGEKMAAYQNHLGGGMMGKVCCNDTIRSHSFYVTSKDLEDKLDKISEALKKFYIELYNEKFGVDASVEDFENMPVSAY